MNLVGKWSLTTPLMGLSHTRSYYEIFSPKFMTFFKQKDYLEIYLKNIHPYHFYLLIFTGSNYFWQLAILFSWWPGTIFRLDRCGTVCADVHS